MGNPCTKLCYSNGALSPSLGGNEAKDVTDTTAKDVHKTKKGENSELNNKNKNGSFLGLGGGGKNSNLQKKTGPPDIEDPEYLDRMEVPSQSKSLQLGQNFRGSRARSTSGSHSESKGTITASSSSSVSSSSCLLQMRYAYMSYRGYYPDDLEKLNQDCFMICRNFMRDPSKALFCVFDGHGRDGDLCSQFVRDKLHEKISIKLKKLAKETDLSQLEGEKKGKGERGEQTLDQEQEQGRGKGQEQKQDLLSSMNTEKSGGNSNSNNKSELKKAKSTRKSLTFLTENNVALVGEAIARAHLEVNDELHRATDVDDNLSGTTSISVIFFENHIYVANVGDSRAILASMVVPHGEKEREEGKQDGDRIFSLSSVPSSKLLENENSNNNDNQEENENTKAIVSHLEIEIQTEEENEKEKKNKEENIFNHNDIDRRKEKEEKEKEKDLEKEVPPEEKFIIPSTVEFEVKALSNDQTPYRFDERQRVKRCGARVMTLDQISGHEPLHENWSVSLGDAIDTDGDPPRVWSKYGEYPGTAFTRSIGDNIAESLGVFALPEIHHRYLNPEDKIIIIASDGVFEFLTNYDVIEIAKAYADPLEACHAIVQESYKLWLQNERRTDDITLICIYIDEIEQKMKSVGVNPPSAGGTMPDMKKYKKEAQEEKQIQEHLELKGLNDIKMVETEKETSVPDNLSDESSTNKMSSPAGNIAFDPSMDVIVDVKNQKEKETGTGKQEGNVSSPRFVERPLTPRRMKARQRRLQEGGISPSPSPSKSHSSKGNQGLSHLLEEELSSGSGISSSLSVNLPSLQAIEALRLKLSQDSRFSKLKTSFPKSLETKIEILTGLRHNLLFKKYTSTIFLSPSPEEPQVQVNNSYCHIANNMEMNDEQSKVLKALQTILVDYLEIKPVSLGEVIIRQGEKGDLFYIVNKGDYEVRVGRNEEEIAKSEGAIVHNYYGGRNLFPCFGELALREEEEEKKIRKASIVSKSADGEIWIIPGEVYALLASEV